MRTRWAILVVAAALAGCGSDGVTQADAERNKQEFSQENYEKAMIAAGKSAELEEEKKRNAEYLRTQGGQGDQQ